jgi:hypothetical protein
MLKLLLLLLVDSAACTKLYIITLTHLHSVTQPRECLCHHPVRQSPHAAAAAAAAR